MKKLLVLLVVAGCVFASDMVPFEQVKDISYNLVSKYYGQHYLDETITYYGIDHQPSAYAFIYRGVTNCEPVTIVMGARYTNTPVNEIIQGVPRSKEAFDLIVDRARLLGPAEPEFQRIYYFGPGQEYCAFSVNGDEYLIHAGFLRAYDPAVFFNGTITRDATLERLTRDKWDAYLNDPNAGTRQDSTYIPNVPFIDWTYGCSPTAASMILWYWDQYAPSPQYGRLVDYFFTRYELLYGVYKDQANVNKELALAMSTDSTTGGSTIGMIRYGIELVCNSWHGYSFTVQLSPQGNSSNQYLFSWLRSELLAGRPPHWNVFQYYYAGDYINHSIVGVGYLISPPDTFIQVHTTWGWSGEPFWNLWTYNAGVYSRDYVIRVQPSGGVTDNLFLDFPQGGFLFKGLKYKIQWTSVGSGIDHLKIWWAYGTQATSYDSTYWNLISSNAPNTGEYVWTAPNQDSALRINIAGYNSSNQRRAADGYLRKTQCVFPNHSSNLTLVGHYPSAIDVQAIEVEGNYAFICTGTEGLYIADVSDSSLPDFISHLNMPGNNGNMAKSGNYLYISDQEDTLRVVSVSNPANPSQVGKLAFSVDQARGICVSGNYAYIACRGTGLLVVDVSTPSSPSLAGSYNTPGQAYDVFVDDTLAYVADGVQGLRILNVSNPSNITEIGFYNTNGITQGIAVSGNICYLAEGGVGIKVMDVSNPANPQQLSSLDTPGTAKRVHITDVLWVADVGGGLRVIQVANPSAPVEVGYMETYSDANGVCHIGSMVYLADGADGVYLIHEEVESAVKETKDGCVAMQVLAASPQKNRIHLVVHVPASTEMSINVFDASGRLCESTPHRLVGQGEHEFTYSPQSAGVYFVQITTNTGSVVNKVVFCK